jgi:hypothetical protein
VQPCRKHTLDVATRTELSIRRRIFPAILAMLFHKYFDYLQKGLGLDLFSRLAFAGSP